jgi:hypothetical protein
MTDYPELLKTIYENVHKLFGLIKDHEQDLNVIDKANSLMADTRSEILWLNDCIHRYVTNIQHSDQVANSFSSEITNPPNASVSAPASCAKNKNQQSYKQPTVTDDSDDDELRSLTNTHYTVLQKDGTTNSIGIAQRSDLVIM